VQKFSDSFDELVETIEEKSRKLISQT
jgi:hypothetical protein